jgi:hypothetical protein
MTKPMAGKKKRKSLVGWAYKSWHMRVYWFDGGQIRLDDELIFKSKSAITEYTMDKINQILPVKKVRITIEEI